jgi:hypothetical protein
MTWQLGRSGQSYVDLRSLNFSTEGKVATTAFFFRRARHFLSSATFEGRQKMAFFAARALPHGVGRRVSGWELPDIATIKWFLYCPSAADAFRGARARRQRLPVFGHLRAPPLSLPSRLRGNITRRSDAAPALHTPVLHSGASCCCRCAAQRPPSPDAPIWANFWLLRGLSSHRRMRHGKNTLSSAFWRGWARPISLCSSRTANLALAQGIDNVLT